MGGEEEKRKEGGERSEVVCESVVGEVDAACNGMSDGSRGSGEGGWEWRRDSGKIEYKWGE